ncbi:MAG TPA: N-acetylgalactosamine-4-sulfatase [Bacteroidales bacterium]|nr:N-acetylgalactosamine-4-sulfatase [Bacteroidales bacterium]
MRKFLKPITLIFFSVIIFSACTVKTEKPNVILIITDDQGYGDLACHGNPWIETPNMDKLWEESMRLTDYHVCPTCAPTRSALMTGRYNNRVGVWHTVTGRTLLRENEVTMAQVFSDNGYSTGMFGKWHLGDNYPRRPVDVGFQRAVYHGGGAVGNTNDYWDNDYFDDHYYDNGEIKQFKGYCTDVWFNEAKSFIDESKDGPFFCYIATNAPHGPLYVEDKYSNQYKGDTLIPSPRFYGMITNIDENIGKLMSYLAEQKLAENTIFIFMTDNGTADGVILDGDYWNSGLPTVYGFNAGMNGMKGTPYDGGHRVPCFIHWPAGGLAEGRDFDGLTAHIDILPSLIEMCGLERINGPEVDGISLWKYLTGKLAWTKGKRTLFVDSQRVEVPEHYRRSAVMQKGWRLVNGRELYDMKTDPGQRLNVAARYPEKVKEMKALYEEWFKDVFSDFETRSYIHIGSEKARSMVLSSHDWMGVVKPDGTRSLNRVGEETPPYAHSIIRRGALINGYWDIKVVRDGKYKIELARWPKEAGGNITEGIPASTVPIPGGQPFGEGKALNIKNARLKIQDFDNTVPVTEEMKTAEFTVDLKSGKTKLRTWFTGDDGLSLGAYYVYITMLE